MRNKYELTVWIVLIMVTSPGIAQTDFLMQSWELQVKPMENTYLKFDFTESSNQLGHSFYPWKQTNYIGNGQVWCNASYFAKLDTLKFDQRSFTSKTVITEKDMLLLDYGDKDLITVTTEMFKEQVVKTARYIPAKILNYFKSNNVPISEKSDRLFAVYEATINKTIIRIYINKHSYLLSKIITVSDDELFGDVETEYIYTNYNKIGELYLALDIAIKKINGKLLDQVQLGNNEMTDNMPILLERPENYSLIDEAPTQVEVSSEKYNDHIHLVELKHTDDKVLIVEFSDFLLVAEAPLNSENGELIIEEAQKVAPNKPIKYFVFGHFHPHYLGGIRPFVHEGARIIASKQNMEYVSYIVNAERTMNPDSQQFNPKPLIFEEIQDSLTISDGKTKMKIYFIGEKSVHTNDYLIYYFPKEKVLFEDDLVWIPKSGEVKKASSRQAGLYHAIKDLDIEVDTIIQSWPVKDYGVKSVIPFEDLEKAMDIKQSE